MEHLQCKNCGNEDQSKMTFSKTPTGMIKASCGGCKKYIKFVSKKDYQRFVKKDFLIRSVSNRKTVGGKHLQHSKSFQRELNRPKLF
jgi:hypothetical protein